MAPWDAAGGGGGMLGGVARGCVFTSAGESGIAVAFSFLSAVDTTGVGDGRKRQREGESGQGVEGLALPRPTCFLGEAPSSWSPGGGDTLPTARHGEAPGVLTGGWHPTHLGSDSRMGQPISGTLEGVASRTWAARTGLGFSLWG